MDYEEMFPSRLSALRNKLGASARDMSLSLGQNPGYINNIENGKALPSMSAFFYICEYLNVTPAEFFSLDTEYPAELDTLISNIKKLDKVQLSSIDTIVFGLANTKP